MRDGARPVRIPSTRALNRAEAHIRAGMTIPDVLRRFAQAIATLWRRTAHVSVVLAEPDGEFRLHRLLPDGPSTTLSPFVSVWEQALLHGEQVICTGPELQAIMEHNLHALTGTRSRAITALGILPVIAGGRILGAAQIGMADHTAPGAFQLAHVPDLTRALARRLLDLTVEQIVAETPLETMAISSPTALILAGPDCSVVQMNGAAAELLQRTGRAVWHSSICDVLGLAHPDDPNHAERCPISRLMHGGERRRGPREVTLTMGGERVTALLALGRIDQPEPGAILSIMPLSNDAYVREQRRKVMSRLLHDLNTPLSGIGLVSELLEPGTSEVPDGIVDAVRMHHADLLRYVSELADYTILNLDSRLPPAQSVSLHDVLEVVVWRLWPYMQRRGQHLHIVGRLDQPLLISQRHLEQAIMAVVFDVSTYAPQGSSILVLPRAGATLATISVEGAGEDIADDAAGVLTDPYLRARPPGQMGGLMSLAASKRVLEYYGGALEIESRDAHLSITLSAPLA